MKPIYVYNNTFTINYDVYLILTNGLKFIFGISGRLKFLSLYLKSYHSTPHLPYMKNMNKPINKIRLTNKTVNDDSVSTKFVIVTYKTIANMINQII